MEKQGLAVPMDVRCQYDVNEQIYRSLSILGIDEVLYPLPKQSPFLELCTMPIHLFLHEEKVQDLYRGKRASVKKDALSLQERPRIITQRRTRGEGSEPLNVGCRHPKRDVGPRKGRVSIQKQMVTPKPQRTTDSGVITIPKEWNAVCSVPDIVVCKSFDGNLCKNREDTESHTAGKIKTISLADNYSIADNLESCLAPSCELDNKIGTFLSSPDFPISNKVLLDSLRSQTVSNLMYILQDVKSCIDPRIKELKSPGNVVTKTDGKSKSQKALPDAEGCQRHGAHQSSQRHGAHQSSQRHGAHQSSQRHEAHQSSQRHEAHQSSKEEPREMLPQSNCTDHDCLVINKNTPEIEKSCLGTKENKPTDSKRDQVRRKNKRHRERKKDQPEPNMVEPPSKPDTNPEVYLGEVKTVLEEHTPAFESRSAEEFHETSPGRRVFCASDLEKDIQVSHSRTSGPRQLRDKQKEKRSHVRQTPVVMYSESECSLLCQKYNN